MSANGAVAIQGCAIRVSRLNADGSPVVSSVAKVQDDRNLIKLELTPELFEGKEFTPESACGVPVISYKDCNRYKRWKVGLTFGDWDPELMELVAGGAIMTAPGSVGRSISDGVLAIYENTINSATAAFTGDDVGRSVVDAGFTVASCTTVSTSPDVSTTGNFESAGVVPGMIVTGTGIPANTTVLSVTDTTDLVLSKNATASGTVTLTFFRVPPETTIVEIVSATEARMSNVSFASGTALDLTFGALGVTTIGYVSPKALLVACPNGFSIELWSKLIVRGTGYQGTAPYPTAGSPTELPSAFIRTGVFRAFVWHGAMGIEDKEHTPMFEGWTSENPNFGTGPEDDWRVTALPAEGDPVDTSTSWAQMADFDLPAPLQPGYQPVP